MNFLFWNTYKNKSINKYIVDIVKSTNTNIIALAEYEDNPNTFLQLLHQEGLRFYQLKELGHKRVKIFTKIHESQISHLYENDYCTFKLFPKDRIVGFIHLPSKLHAKEHDLTYQIQKIISKLQQEEIKYKTDQTLILGDFNINPYEEIMVSALGYHAISSKQKSKQISRTVKNEEFNFFYNPMWNLYKDFEDLPGSYYYTSSEMYTPFWNIFDQVILRPSLIDNLKIDSLKFINKIYDISLLTPNGLPDKKISDHLPLVFTIST